MKSWMKHFLSVWSNWSSNAVSVTLSKALCDCRMKALTWNLAEIGDLIWLMHHRIICELKIKFSSIIILYDQSFRYLSTSWIRIAFALAVSSADRYINFVTLSLVSIVFKWSEKQSFNPFPSSSTANPGGNANDDWQLNLKLNQYQKYYNDLMIPYILSSSPFGELSSKQRSKSSDSFGNVFGGFLTLTGLTLTLLTASMWSTNVTHL